MKCEDCEKLKAAQAETLRVSEMERRRFSMDMHDDICQRLSGISMYCKSLVNSDDPKVILPEISQLIDDTITEIKNYSNNIYPMLNEKQDLKNALEKLCREAVRQNKIKIDFVWNVDSDWPRVPDIKLNLYRIVQEALQNALKHSRANLIEVNVSLRDDIYTVIIQDNGKGDVKILDENDAGFGLNSIRYRVNQIKGSCKIDSKSPGGTTITINIPG